MYVVLLFTPARVQAEVEAASVGGTRRNSPSVSVQGTVKSHSSARHALQHSVCASPAPSAPSQELSGAARLEAMLAAAEQAAVPSPPASVKHSEPAASAAGDGPASLASTFCEEVKAKIKRLQGEVDERDSSISGLHIEMQRLIESHQYALSVLQAAAYICLLESMLRTS